MNYHFRHMKLAIGILALAAFLVFASAQIAAGYAGIEHGMGPVWALAAVFAAVFLRFTLPITVGAFFGAMTLWGWHWAPALRFRRAGAGIRLSRRHLRHLLAGDDRGVESHARHPDLRGTLTRRSS